LNKIKETAILFSDQCQTYVVCGMR